LTDSLHDRNLPGMNQRIDSGIKSGIFGIETNAADAVTNTVELLWIRLTTCCGEIDPSAIT
jgi:hypothetical protein